MATREPLRKEEEWPETTIKFGQSGVATLVSVGISGGGIFASTGRKVATHTGVFDEYLYLKMENVKLRAENESLRAEVVAMQATNSPEKVLEIREIPREQAKEEVRAFFKGAPWGSHLPK